MNCGGIPQNNWVELRLIVVELHNERGGSEEEWERGWKAGVRGLSGISGAVRWSPVLVLLTVERGEMCFESYIPDVCYPKRLFPLCRILVWDSIVKIDYGGVVLFCVGARGSCIEVRTNMRKILYEALRTVSPNPSDAPVILVIPKWRITITTTSIISLKNKKREVDSTVFKNIGDRSKCIHQPIFKAAREFMLSTKKSVLGK